jgi:hypothetical protein
MFGAKNRNLFGPGRQVFFKFSRIKDANIHFYHIMHAWKPKNTLFFNFPFLILLLILIVFKKTYILYP